MKAITSLLAVSLTAGVIATPTNNNCCTRSAKEIQWNPCGDELGINATTPLFCGSLTVPLDYTEPESEETLDLQVMKIPASREPSKGSVFFNFGGPGGSGIVEMAVLGEVLRALVGGSYDIINIVPRGTGNTLPFSCYETNEERSASAARAPFATNASNTALGSVWAESQNRADACLHSQNTTGSLIGTAFTARDIMCAVDVLEDDGMLRFWGMSYGSLLGSTLVSMFPDRVDRVLLDAVMNGHQYYRDDLDQATDADSAFSGFCAQCVDNKDSCLIAGDRTAAELEEDIYTALETLKYNPIPLSAGGIGILLDYATLKGQIYNSLYNPITWPKLAQTLDILFSGNATSIIADFFQPAPPPAPDAEAILGIKCSDKLLRASTLEEVLPSVEARWELSRIGGDIVDVSVLQCARWRMPAKEQYAGDFQVKTAHPVLLVSTQNDPNTPLVSARNMSAGFEGSVVLEQAGYGHTILSQASLCTVKITSAYFENGTLPEPGTVCEVDAVPFSGDPGWVSVLTQLSSVDVEA
ncbi:related to hydrolases or acyltransferases (alpha/beta hydrolase superfamily) [Cephalotrichum gorgonifer]|uniref:Related to hydrolases or acyltransferases (Alpha/beta hydrolase superfamily) n=1 Tax=Cephalotrichum gorgonifer TaxID=2041049 RepID=A0AAE8SVD8_9PEZI|nr:related to hydrolases or acyltransferases (alpha/beta hydrolase superfamily) [Cephalotrichum gorgonifer]